MVTEPNSERVQGAIETILEEFGDVNHLEINCYELNNGDRYTNFYCPESIPGVEQSPRNRYKLTWSKVDETPATALVPVDD